MATAERDEQAGRWIEYLPLSDLRPDLRNPKLHSMDVLRESMARFQFTEPVQVDDRTGLLVSGHGRRELLLDEFAAGAEPPEGVRVAGDGQWLVPVVRGWSSRDDDEAYAAIVAANRIGELGGWQADLLASGLERLAVLDDGMVGVGYSSDDLAALLAELAPPVEPPAMLTDPDDVPEPPKTPITKRGDLWLCGEHRLLCGDATSEADLAVLMADERASLLWTDPPYGVSYAAKNRFLNTIWPANRVQEPILGDHEQPGDMAAFWTEAFGAVREWVTPGASYYVTGPQGGDLLLLLLLSLRDAGFPLRHMLIWAKNQFVIGRSDYHYQHEPLLYGWVEGAAHTWFGDHSESSVWHIDKPFASRLHPTMKPVALITRSLNNSTQVGGVVLDPFGGSGSTLIACHLSGRKARLLEIDAHYCDVTVRRWEELTGEKAERVEANPLEPRDATAV